MAKAAWGASSARLSRESFLPFGSCGLCLGRARDPVACASHGDLFCRECALSDLLAQKKEMRRAARARDAEDRDARDLQARRDDEAQSRAVREFELTQAGLEARAAAAAAGKAAPPVPVPTRTEAEAQEAAAAADGAKRGEKRKFALDADELARIAGADRAKARRALDDEKAAAQPALPSYWAPGVTPGSDRRDALHDVRAPAKTVPVCPASPPAAPHAYSLHVLVAVRFTSDDNDDGGGGDGDDDSRVCPACRKALSNSSRATLAKPCGHVLCGSCVDQFMRPTLDPHDPRAGMVRCYVCDADLGGGGTPEKGEGGKGGKEKIRPGLVLLRSEGTGFSAGGTNQVKKLGVSFQC